MKKKRKKKLKNNLKIKMIIKEKEQKNLNQKLIKEM